MQIKFSSDRQDQFNFLGFFWQQKSLILSTFLIILVGSLGLSRVIGKKDNQMSDFYKSGQYYVKLAQQKEVNPAELSKIIKMHKELSPIFNPYLHQNYVLKGDFESAKKISDESLKRLSFIDPLYLEFAKISHLIDLGYYSNALDFSKQLELKLLDKKLRQLSELNRVRILFLEKQLNPQACKHEEWAKLKSTISFELISHLSDDQVSLFDM
jgi:hypothetical protein